jgi:hypothetical protein
MFEKTSIQSPIHSLQITPHVWFNKNWSWMPRFKSSHKNKLYEGLNKSVLGDTI